MGSLRRKFHALPIGTSVRLPSGRFVQVRGTRAGRGVNEVELCCVYLHPRLHYLLPDGQHGRNQVRLTQRFVLAFGEALA